MRRYSTGRRRLAVGLAAAVVAVSMASSAGAEGKVKVDPEGVVPKGGAVKGVVKFDGRQANRKPIRMGADAYCEQGHADDQALSETYIFNENGTLRNVFVWISGGLENQTFATPEAEVVIDQDGCMYKPHVVGVVVGQVMKILNSDNTLHNVNCQPKINGTFNNGMPVKGMVLDKRFTKAEVGIPVKCDVHPWMSAYIHVLDHPYFAVTGEDGSFEISGLGEGEYELSVWHEFDKFKPDSETIKVTVTEGGVAEVEVTYRPPGKKK